MKKIHLVSMLLMSLCFGVLLFTPKTDDVYASYSRYTTSSVNVRTKASMSGKVVGSFAKGKKVTCYGTSGSFTKVKYNGSYRYTATSYLSSKKTSSSSSSSSSSSTYTRYIKAASLNVRKAASNSGAIVGSVSKGTKVTCYGTSGSFTKIKYNGSYRYVSTSYLTSTKTTSSSSSSSNSSSSSSTYTRYITASSLNVRKKASTSGAIAGSVSKGTKVTCYGKSGSFTKIKYNGSYCYVSTQYLSSSKPSSSSNNSSSSSYTRYITASSLNVRKKASTSGTIAGSVSKGTKVTCYGTSGSFTKIKYNGNYCYVSTQYLSSSKPSGTTSSSVTGSQIANYALKFLGNPYVWGGTSLTNGADCSGYTMSVLAHFGIYVPHSSISQRYVGSSVSLGNRKAGDLVCYNAMNGIGHVGIYIGNNQVVHAGSTSTGIHISTWNYRSVNCIRRVSK
ncbi:MAG: SH3 domain-containing protein [Anaerostipes sp.]|nr:SH3 domain-containing protein [Anaerostipes sp.]